MMKNTTINISIRVIKLFVIAIMMSFVADNVHEFLGDNLCNGNIEAKVRFLDYCKFGYYHAHGESYHWGFRHWTLFFLGIILASIQAISIIITIHE